MPAEPNQLFEYVEHLFSDVGIYTVRLHAIRKDGISFLKSKPDAEKQVIVQ